MVIAVAPVSKKCYVLQPTDFRSCGPFCAFFPLRLLPASLYTVRNVRDNAIMTAMRNQGTERELQLRATQAVVDLSAIRHNVRQIRRELPQGCSILVVVKGNSYGLGAVEISKMLQMNSVEYLGVATLSEVADLRNGDITTPILMLTEPFIDEYVKLLNLDTTLTVFSENRALEIDIVAGANSCYAKLHLKVDTGMGRVGCPYEEAFDIACGLSKNLRFSALEGIYTHFPVADEPDEPGAVEFTQRQIGMMQELKERLDRAGVFVPYYHCANTGGVLNFPQAAFDMVRVGISAYGCHPSTTGKRLDLRDVLTLKTKVIYLKRVPAGTSVSYGRTYTTSKETTIVTLPVGYTDGYPRALSNKGRVSINGKSYTIAGRVCMDMCMVDVSDDPVRVGDEATLIGGTGENRFSLDDAAAICGTIPYEILVRISPRVPRLPVGLEGIDQFS
jgi:alanine racemase